VSVLSILAICYKLWLYNNDIDLTIFLRKKLHFARFYPSIFEKLELNANLHLKGSITFEATIFKVLLYRSFLKSPYRFTFKIFTYLSTQRKILISKSCKMMERKIWGACVIQLCSEIFSRVFNEDIVANFLKTLGVVELQQSVARDPVNMVLTGSRKLSILKRRI